MFFSSYASEQLEKKLLADSSIAGPVDPLLIRWAQELYAADCAARRVRQEWQDAPKWVEFLPSAREQMKLTEWDLWGARDQRGVFCHVGRESYTRLAADCRGKNATEIVVPVRAVRNAEGAYYGWWGAGEEAPSMIFQNYLMYSICFAGGPKRSEETFQGITVRLNITERTVNQQ